MEPASPWCATSVAAQAPDAESALATQGEQSRDDLGVRGERRSRVLTDEGVDRDAGGFVIPMTWFQSLNPLFVMLMTPPLLAYWRRRTEAGHAQAAAKRMALGAAIVASSYLLLAAVEWAGDGQPAGWMWLALFFLLFTFGELFILPTGLGLFARLAPPHLGATTVAAWFFVIFTGSLSAGLVGTLWSSMDHLAYFVMLAAIASSAALLLRLLHAPTEAVDRSQHPAARDP